MKDYPYVPGWRLNKDSNKPRVKTSVLMLTKHGVVEGEWEGSDWVQYRWSCKVKDSDVLYWIHLEDLTQLEKEGQPFQQEQPEVNLEKEYKEYVEDDPVFSILTNRNVGLAIAYHFFELGLNAGK